jgi:hypothetical protein
MINRLLVGITMVGLVFVLFGCKGAVNHVAVTGIDLGLAESLIDEWAFSKRYTRIDGKKGEYVRYLISQSNDAIALEGGVMMGMALKHTVDIHYLKEGDGVLMSVQEYADSGLFVGVPKRLQWLFEEKGYEVERRLPPSPI